TVVQTCALRIYIGEIWRKEREKNRERERERGGERVEQDTAKLKLGRPTTKHMGAVTHKHSDTHTHTHTHAHSHTHTHTHTHTPTPLRLLLRCPRLGSVGKPPSAHTEPGIGAASYCYSTSTVSL